MTERVIVIIAVPHTWMETDDCLHGLTLGHIGLLNVRSNDRFDHLDDVLVLPCGVHATRNMPSLGRNRWMDETGTEPSFVAMFLHMSR